MKNIIYTIAICSYFFGATIFASEKIEILKRHFAAYNHGDIETLASTIHDEIEEITYPNIRKSNSKEELLKNWEKFIKDFKPVVTIKYISEIGERVVAIEELQLYQDGKLVEKVEVAEIYEFRDGKIISAVVVDDQ